MAQNTRIKFRDLAVGDTFDWVNPAAPAQNSFYDYCLKTGARTYENETGRKFTVGSIDAKA